MRIGLAWAIGAALVGLGSAAEAASFDCAKASRPIEQRICADPALSRADEDLAAAFRAALALSPTPLSFRKDQREWLATLKAASPDLLGAYRGRTSELKAFAAAAAAVRRPVQAASLGARCVPVQGEYPCKVVETGRAGLGQGPDYLWQQQELSGDGYVAGQAMVVLEPSADGRTATPVLWMDEESAFYGPPELVRSPAGPLVEISGHLDGTGDFNAGGLFRLEAGRFVELDSWSWRGDLARRLPKGLEVWKGVYPDWKTMTGSTGLWRTTDGNCCPTGGRADVTLHIEGDAVVLDQVKITRGARAAEGE